MAENPAVDSSVVSLYAMARTAYACLGVDTDAVLQTLAGLPVSVQCWQGDDVRGLEDPDAVLSGGIMAIGNYPGGARSGNELRADMLKTFSLLPGKQRANIHAFYCEPEEPVERDGLLPEHFTRWMAWSKENGIALDFNPTFFSHSNAKDGLTLTHPDEKIRKYWIRHGIACRRIAEAFARNQGCPCVCNFWIPDGCKDSPADRWSPRKRLIESYDTIFDPVHGIDPSLCIDSVESKLFGLGSEAYVAGSHEFYLGYALTRNVIPCLDMGHFHPTETIDDKISALLQYTDRLLLHLSRGIRWDSDHVVLFTDDVKQVCHELVRGDMLDRVYIALDFFDASINRVGAWVIGTRAVLQALLYALLEPVEKLQEYEMCGDGAGKLALLERMKTMPFGAVWDYFCLQQDVPVGLAWLDTVKEYERDVLLKREVD
jgi:L-rhamnose isomerase